MGLVVADLPWLEEKGQEILDLERSLERKTHEVRKRQGEILLAVKEKLGHGNFTKWLKTLGWSDRTARHFIQQFKEGDKPKRIEAAKPNLELIEAEVIEVEDDDLIESAHFKSANFAVLEEEDFEVKRLQALSRLKSRNFKKLIKSIDFKVGDQVITKNNTIAIVKSVNERFVTFEFEYFPNDFRTLSYQIELAGEFAEPIEQSPEKSIEVKSASVAVLENFEQENQSITLPSSALKETFNPVDLLQELADAIYAFQWEQGHLWAQAKGSQERVKVEFALHKYEKWRVS